MFPRASGCSPPHRRPRPSLQPHPAPGTRGRRGAGLLAAPQTGRPCGTIAPSPCICRRRPAPPLPPQRLNRAGGDCKPLRRTQPGDRRRAPTKPLHVLSFGSCNLPARAGAGRVLRHPRPPRRRRLPRRRRRRRRLSRRRAARRRRPALSARARAAA